MPQYVMVESRDPFESRDVPYFYNLARDLAAKGEKVTLFLVQNGALASRKNAKGNPLTGLLDSSVEILVDAFSLSERGIQDSEKLTAVKTSGIDDLVCRIMAEDGTKILWH